MDEKMIRSLFLATLILAFSTTGCATLQALDDMRPRTTREKMDAAYQKATGVRTYTPEQIAALRVQAAQEKAQAAAEAEARLDHQIMLDKQEAERREAQKIAKAERAAGIERRNAEAAEARRLHNLRPDVIAANAAEKASREMILAVYEAGNSDCQKLPPQYMSVCFRTNNRGINDALGSVLLTGPDPGKTRRVIDACSTDPGIAEDMRRRPQVAPALLLGCIEITYATGGF
jgi:hypothetical protein